MATLNADRSFFLSERGHPITTNIIMLKPYTFKKYGHVSHKELNAMMD
jgi:hypothetical protein